MRIDQTNYSISYAAQKQLMLCVNNLKHIHKIPVLKDSVVAACCKVYGSAKEAAATLQAVQSRIKTEHSLSLEHEADILEEVISTVIGDILGQSKEMSPASMEETIASVGSSAETHAKPELTTPPFSELELTEYGPHRDSYKFFKWATCTASTEDLQAFLNHYLTPANVDMPMNSEDPEETMLTSLAKTDNFASIIELFAKKGANFNIVSGQWRNPPLTWAIANGSYESAYKLIHTGLCDLTLQDGSGKTPLHLLVAKNYVDTTVSGEPILRPTASLIQEMMAQVRDTPEVKRTLLDRQDSKGNTALHLACMRRDIQTIAYLLEEGARIDIRNTEGKLPIDMLDTPAEEVHFILMSMVGDLYAPPERLSDPTALQAARALLSKK